MKGLIITRMADLPWAEGLGLGHHWQVEFLGKTLLDQNIEYLQSQGVEEIRILSDHGQKYLEKWAESRPELSVRSFTSGRGILDLMVSQGAFWNGQGGLVIPGPVYMGHGGQGAAYSGYAPLILEKGRLSPWDECGPWTSVSTVRDFHVLAMELLQLSGSIWQGSGVYIHPKAQVGPAASLGSGVRINSEAEVSQTVIFPGVEVGKGVVLKDKVVIGTWILEPRKGTRTQVTDRAILKVKGT